MMLADLEAEERMALGALVRLVVARDGTFSAEEQTVLTRCGEHFGSPDILWDVIAVSASTHLTADAIRESALRVRRSDAQQLILQILDAVVASDGVTISEHELLMRIRQLWTRERSNDRGPFR